MDSIESFLLSKIQNWHLQGQILLQYVRYVKSLHQFPHNCMYRILKKVKNVLTALKTQKLQKDAINRIIVFKTILFAYAHKKWPGIAKLWLKA